MHLDYADRAQKPWPIVLENVSVTYPNGTHALRDVSLRIEPGEMVAIVGLSGSGKSTLIRTINALTETTAGRVSVGPYAINELKGGQLREARGQIGMIFQQFNLAERTDVYHNVLVGSFSRNPWWRALLDLPTEHDKEIALRSLGSVGMLEKVWARAGALSGGQKQRVAIARALTQQPAVMLADEPVASLDPPTAHSVMADLMRINQEQGLTVLVNLHAIDLARQYTTRLVGLRQGELVYDGPTNEATDADFEQIYGRRVLPGDMAGKA